MIHINDCRGFFLSRSFLEFFALQIYKNTVAAPHYYTRPPAGSEWECTLTIFLKSFHLLTTSRDPDCDISFPLSILLVFITLILFSGSDGAAPPAKMGAPSFLRGGGGGGGGGQL